MIIQIFNMPVRENAEPNNVPLGVYYLVSAIETSFPDAAVYVTDLNVRHRATVTGSTLDLGIAEHADVVMLSGLITTLKRQIAIAEFVRKINPKAIIVSGGGLATNCQELLYDWMPVDTICVGEGDVAVIELLNDIRAGRSLKVKYQTPVTKIESMPAWDMVDKLETYILNPIWGDSAKNSSAISGYKIKRSLNIITGRGCPYGCRFCSRDATGGRRWRGRSAESVFGEMAYLHSAHKVDFIGFMDDNFAVSKTRLRKLCEMITSSNLKLKWGGHIRFNNADDRDLLMLMKRAGCVYLGFGGESANPDILSAMNKGNDPMQMVGVISMCREVGIHPNVTWMMGWPGETREQIRQTARFMMKYAPENPYMFCATAYPGTDLWSEVGSKVIEKFGSLKDYVLQLGDANLPLVNYTSMPDAEFKEVASHATNGRLKEI